MFTIESSPQLPLRILDRLTTPEEPGVNYGGYGSPTELAVAYEFLGLGNEYREEHINSSTALTCSAIWACVRWISQTIASLSFNVFERQGEGNEPVPLEDNVAWLVGMQPNPEVNSFEFWQALIKDALLFGNGYAEIEKDGFNRIRWMWRLSPDRVMPERNGGGDLVYSIKNVLGQEEKMLRADQIFHLKNLGSDGIVGWSVIELARRTIEIALAQEKFGQSFFRRGPMPGGILKVPMNQTPDKRMETKRTFEQAYGGKKNAGGVVVISSGYEFTPLTLPNKDAEWIASRQFSVEEVARWFGVPPHKIGDLSRSTFSNIEHQAIEAVQDCLLPWCRRLESEADIKLFGQVARGRRFTKLNLETLLRGDSMTQTETLVKQVQGGLRTNNEGRRMLGLNPKSEGEKLLVQGATTTLERVIDGTAQVGTPQPGTAPGQHEPAKTNPDGTPIEPAPKPSSKPAALADMPPELVEPFKALLCKCISDFLFIQGDKAYRAANKGKLSEHCESFYKTENFEDVRSALEPIFSAFLAASHRNSVSAKDLAEDATDRHMAWSKRIMLDCRKLPENWKDMAMEIAEAELQLAWSKSK